MQVEDQLYIKSGRLCSWISQYVAIAILSLLPLSHSLSQSFSGAVKGKSGGRLMGANVLAAKEDGKTVAYSITDENGRFRIVVPTGDTPDNVIVSYIGYQTKKIPFGQIKDGMTITLVESSFKLREVSVSSQRIKGTGDTLTYSVTGFRQKQDRSIADVIAKMPGMEVKADGRIEYQGRTINKFYVEGLDLMGAQYGIANKNISADKVVSVQVMQNHQPVRSLRGVSFTDQAALNIVLKDEAKAVWNGAADVGLGYGDDFLYDCRLMGMRFNKKFQTLMMYKNNNTGKDIATEVLDLTAQANGISESGIVSMPVTGTPQLNSERYTFNKSHLAAGNWLWRTGQNTELRLQGNGFINTNDMQSYSQTTYLTLADLPVIIEEQTLSNTRCEWKGEANFQYNGDRTYFRNNVRGYIDFNKSIGWATVSSDHTDMAAKPRKRSLSEVFTLSHTTQDKNVFEFNSNTSYNYLPEQLLTLNGATEKLNLRFFTTQNFFKNKLKVGKHYVNNQIGLDYYNQYIDVAYIDETDLHNTYSLLQPYLQPSLSLLFEQHKVDAAVKLSYARQQYRQSKSDEIWLEPSLRWNWQLSPLSEVSANIRYEAKPLMGKAIYDMPIFTNYQTRKRNLGKTSTQHTLSLNIAYKYSNPIKGIFLNVRPIFNSTSGNILYETRLDNSIYTLTATERNYTTTTWGGSTRLSKSFGWAKSVLGISTFYTTSDYKMLVSSNVNNARMQSLTISIDYSLRPSRLLSVEGKSSMQFICQQNLSRQDLSSGCTTHWQHRLSLYCFLTDSWMLTVKNEYFHNSEHYLGSNYFCDLAISYKQYGWDLSLSAQNIIGTSQYETRILGNAVENYSVTRLRPRELLAKICFDI